MKRKALLIYYSQCGQTKRALDSFSSELEQTFELTNLEICPKNPYEFPWKMTKFFRAFPRCVKEDFPEINNLNSEVLAQKYDLVVIGYQVWFLSPSLPILSLMSELAFKKLIRGSEVVGIITSRNMWISAVANINQKLRTLGAKSIKNLVLCDTAPAWATFVTTPRWMLTGKKAAFSIFPEAGIAQEEFQRASIFASFITKDTSIDELVSCSHHQSQANITMEKIGRSFFECWAAVIYRLTLNDGLFRDFLLVLFRINLVFLILFLLPVVSIYTLFRGEKTSALMRDLLIPN